MNHETQAFERLFNEIVDKDLEYIINKWVSPNETNNCPLIVAAAFVNNVNAVKLLIENNASVNRTNRFRENSTYVACFNNNLEMLQLLMANGGDPNLIPRDDIQQTSLICAAFHGNLPMIKCLLNPNKNHKHSFDWVCQVARVCSCCLCCSCCIWWNSFWIWFTFVSSLVLFYFALANKKLGSFDKSRNKR